MAETAKVIDIEDAVLVEEPRPRKKQAQPKPVIEDPFIYDAKAQHPAEPTPAEKKKNIFKENSETIGDKMKAMTPEQRSASAKKAAATRLEKIRKRKSIQQLALTLLDTELPKASNLRAAIDAAGIDDYTGASAILFVQFRRACNGDLEAAKFLRDTSGQKPVDGINVGTADNPVGNTDLTRLSDKQLKQLVAKVETDVDKNGM